MSEVWSGSLFSYPASSVLSDGDQYAYVTAYACEVSMSNSVQNLVVWVMRLQGANIEQLANTKLTLYLGFLNGIRVCRYMGPVLCLDVAVGRLRHCRN